MSIIKSMMDGSLFVQQSYIPTAGQNNSIIYTYEDFKKNVEIPANIPVRSMDNGKLIKTGETVNIGRNPSESEMKDMWFGWMVETCVTSNSVLTAKNLATVSIGVGGQDRVMMAKQCVSKAYESRKALISLRKHGMLFDALMLEARLGVINNRVLDAIEEESMEGNAGLEGAIAASDAFFPFRDGVDALLEQGIKAIVQPSGSLRDADAVQACNEKNATMVFTHMRCFKH